MNDLIESDFLWFRMIPWVAQVCPFSDSQESSAESGVGIENIVRSQWVQHGNVGSCKKDNSGCNQQNPEMWTDRNQQKPAEANRNQQIKN
jgi:hypothetical protein